MSVSPASRVEIPEHLRVRPITVTPSAVVQWIKPEAPSELERRCMELLVPGDYEIYDEKVANYLDEAREIFIRSGVTSMLRSGDLIVGLYTANGDLANASAGTYLHCVTATLPVKYILQEFLADPTVGVREGDIFYANEARFGGIHNCDQMAMMPVFHDGELIAWTAALAHQPETGAVEPGGMPLSARSRNDEGMKLTPIKIGENFRIRSDMLRMMENFIGRAPRMQAVDTRARVTGADRLRVRVCELAAEKGNDFVRGLLRKLVVEAERAARKRIAQWNDGVYRATVFIDTIGREPALVRGVLTASKRGESIVMDFTGSSPENDSPYNCYPHIAAAHAAIYIYAYPFHDLPVSNGTLAPFEWVVPQGCLFNAGSDAAISNSPVVNSLVMSLTPLALGRMMYDSGDRRQVGAPNSNNGSAVIFAGINQHGIPVAELEATTLNTEGQGARTDLDGVHAYGFPWCHAGRSPDAEDTETEYQFLRLFFNLRGDSGGFGKYQGGAGTETALIPYHVPYFFWQGLGKSSAISCSAGLFGGYPSSACPGIWVKDTDLFEKMARGDADLPANAVELATRRAIGGEYVFESINRPTRIGKNGDVIVQFAAGGGGYGDVLLRDPAAVVADVRSGIVSRWTAQNVYCVRFDAETLRVDEAGTARAREAERRRRRERGKTWDEFHAEWST
ncbi:MAG: hydantoinase B/oxoprolinase family protein, partial [Deltaproteobacteria bacterium]|nr:hydantoinase B/oxoprolinase family protein [Deltaproteobacteria bacterium]